MVDMLIIGGGLAGLSAAARAVQDGASVVVVEKGPSLGGSAVYAGFLWTAPTLGVMREVNPDGDPELGARLVDGYDDAIEWVQSLGVATKEPVTVLGYGRGVETDMTGLIAACERVVRQGEDAEIVLGAQTSALIRSHGRVRGAEIVTAEGEQRRIEARSTVLATGGFGGDPDLRAQHIHPLARDLPLRANPHSTGDGLRLRPGGGGGFATEGGGLFWH